MIEARTDTTVDLAEIRLSCASQCIPQFDSDWSCFLAYVCVCGQLTSVHTELTQRVLTTRKSESDCRTVRPPHADATSTEAAAERADRVAA
jgi:hypothetical protein